MPNEVDLDNLPSNNPEVPNRRPQKATLRGAVRQGSNRGGIASEVRDIFNTQFTTMMKPSIMRLVYDFMEGALRMMILGSSSSTNSSRLGGRRMSYNSQYRSNRPTYRRAGESGRNYHQAQKIQETPYEDIFFGNYADAEDVLNIMKETIREFGWCSVGHLYSVCGIDNNHTHHSWGWTNVNHVGITRADQGFFIDLPNPVAK